MQVRRDNASTPPGLEPGTPPLSPRIHMGEFLKLAVPQKDDSHLRLSRASQFSDQESDDSWDLVMLEYQQKLDELSSLTAALPLRLQRSINNRGRVGTGSQMEPKPDLFVVSNGQVHRSHQNPKRSSIGKYPESYWDSLSESRFTINAQSSTDVRDVPITPSGATTPRLILTPKIAMPLKEEQISADDDEASKISRDFEDMKAVKELECEDARGNNSGSGRLETSGSSGKLEGTLPGRLFIPTGATKRVSMSADLSNVESTEGSPSWSKLDIRQDSMEKSRTAQSSCPLSPGTHTKHSVAASSSMVSPDKNSIAQSTTDTSEKWTLSPSPQARMRNKARQISQLVLDMGNGSRLFGENSEVLEILHTCCPIFFKRREPTAAQSDKIAADRIFSGTATNPTAAGDTGKFDIMVGFLIIANCIVMMIELEYQGHRGEVKMGVKEDNGEWPNAETWFYVLEHVFNALFLLELLFRFLQNGVDLFKDKSMVFDALLVIVSSIQIYIIDPMSQAEDGSGGGGAKMSLFRMLRFIRFVRVLRLVRVLRMFSALRVLVKTVVSSFGALVWSMVLLLVIMIMGGLFLSELLKDFILDENNDIVLRKWVFKHYGTSMRAIYTLFEVTLSGCWPNYFRPLIHSVSGWYTVFALGYIAVVVFAIIRIITAIFLKETLTIASNDAEMMVQERLKHKENYVKKLGNLFKAVDVSGDGNLSLDEFEVIVSNPMVRTWLQVLELEVHDAKALFRLLDDGDGTITYDEFLTGLMRLKGQARTMDVVSIMRNTDKTLAELKQLKSLMVRLNGGSCVRPSMVESVHSEPLNKLDSCRY